MPKNVSMSNGGVSPSLLLAPSVGSGMRTREHAARQQKQECFMSEKANIFENIYSCSCGAREGGGGGGECFGSESRKLPGKLARSFCESYRIWRLALLERNGPPPPTPPTLSARTIKRLFVIAAQWIKHIHGVKVLLNCCYD